MLSEKIFELDQKVRQFDERFAELGYDMRALVQTEIKTRWKIPAQAETMFGMHTAICIDTIDPWKQGRVRFFSPLLHDQTMPVKSMPWAYPVAAQGGFDDSGGFWVPPAGSKLCLIFEMGNRQTPFYIGTTWDRDRGPDGSHKWNYNVEEYYKLHDGERGGYLIGSNDGSQSFPPWNTQTYNGYDIDSIQEFEEDPEAQKKITYPNHYGWKSPQKAMMVMVDGNYKCNFRDQRMEWKSVTGNYFVMKDDHLHPGGHWAHPKCGCGGGDISTCNDADGNPLEETSCPNTSDQSTCGNPYFKHESECRPFRGPGTPQNNRVDAFSLPQSGIMMLSHGGHAWWMDDSVEEPRGVPGWKRSTLPFDTGCTDKITGQMVIKSMTGHALIFSDKESKSKVRGEENYIKLKSAAGISIELNDHSVDCACAGGQDKAGERRGIFMETTAGNEFQMCDKNNEHCGPCRKEGGSPKKKATDAYIKLRTGYGIEFKMSDDHSQESTDKQYLQMTCPQKDACCGPHIFRMQEDKECGQIFIRAAGDFICMTEGDHYEVVGVGKDGGETCEGGCLGPRNKITVVSQHTLHSSCNFYFNTADIHAFMADRMILLMAGKDCKSDGEDDCQPCVWPVVVLRNNCLAVSDRVFASASCNAECASIYQLQPFISGPLSGDSCCS